MAQLRREIDGIHARGAELVVIGNGTLFVARAFRDDLGLTSPLYVDPTRASYRAMGMKRGVRKTIGSPRIWLRHLAALRVGVRERRVGAIIRGWSRAFSTLIPTAHGDAWQLGGVMIVLPGGRVPYRYVSEEAGDHPPVADILAALGS